MSKFTKFLIGLVLVPTILAALAYYVWPTGHGITDKLEQRASAVLQEQGFSWAGVDFDPEGDGARYRIGTITGTPPTPDAPSLARDLVLKSLGGLGFGAGVHDVRAVAPPPPADAPPYVWKAEARPEALLLTGTIPSEDVRKQIVDYATSKFAPRQIIDQMTVRPDVPAGDWIGAVKRGLDHVASLGNQSAEMINTELTVIGTTSDMGLSERIRTDLANTMPSGFAGRAIIEAGDAGAVPEPAPAPAATAEVVDQCQRRIDEVMANQVIEFDTAQATLREDPNPLLDRLYDVMAACPGTTVTVTGHTDKRGSAAANQRLSEARAQTVVAYLVRKGLTQDRLTAIGKGEAEPLDPADNDEAYARNRRIAFSVATAGGN